MIGRIRTGRTLDDEWRSRAACRGMDTDLFFPRDRKAGEAAIRVCRGCPVAVECGEWADGHRACGYRTVGVWGGTFRRGL